MKITDSSVSLSSSHELRQEHTKEESLRMWVGPTRPDFAESEGAFAQDVRITLSPEAYRYIPQTVEATEAEQDLAPAEDPKLAAIRRVLEILTGKKVRVSEFSPTNTQAPESTESSEDASAPVERQGWGLEYDYHEKTVESESLRFDAAGRVQTADGRTINFRLELNLAREFIQEDSIMIRAGDALIDPLVINFSGNAAELTDMRFAFDLDADGKKEEIPFVRGGSGFLFLDRNGDNVVNNGSELFGPSSGHGFSELAELDSDGNGWIDDADPLYSALKIWMKDAAGNDYFASLAEKNIGALYLTTTDTEYSLTTNNNALLGRLRESSIFIREDGSVGSVQEILLTV